MPLRIRTICSGKGNTNRRSSPLLIIRLNPVQYEFRRQRHSPCDWVRSNARSMAISNTPPSTIPRESRMRLGGHRPEAFAAGRREVGAGTSIIGIEQNETVYVQYNHQSIIFVCFVFFLSTRARESYTYTCK
jgi:hypothetical protein